MKTQKKRYCDVIDVNGAYIKDCLYISNFSLNSLSKVFYLDESSLGAALRRNRLSKTILKNLCSMANINYTQAITFSKLDTEPEQLQFNLKEEDKDKLAMILEYQKKINELLIQLIKREEA